MPDESSAKQDHPYVAHYDWSAIPGVEDPERLTPERQAENAQHAADREAVEGGRTLRLIAAAPIVVWSFVGIPVLALFAILALVGVVGRDTTVGEGFTPGAVGLIALIVLIEVASIWEGMLLFKNRISPGRWLIVLVLTVIVAVAVGFSLWPWSAMAMEGWAAVGATVYSVAVAAWQTVRSRRLTEAAVRLERYSP